MVGTVSVFRRLDASETDSGGRASAAGGQIVFDVARGSMAAVSVAASTLKLSSRYRCTCRGHTLKPVVARESSRPSI